MIFWMLAREVMVLRGELEQGAEWDVVVDLFYYKVETEAVAQKTAVGGLDAEEKAEHADWDKEAEKKDEADENWA